MRKKALQNYSNKEISITLNNAVTQALRPQGRVISDARLRNMRAYAEALIEPLKDHMLGAIDEETGQPYAGFIAPHEVVGILVCAALAVQLQYVVGIDKLPAKYSSDILFGEDEAADES